MPNSEPERWYKNAVANLNPDFIPIRSIFSQEEHGYSLNGTHFLSVKSSFEHLLLVGATGVGKSTKILIPTLAKLNGSAVIHDTSKELLQIMEEDLKKRGFRIQILNFSEPGWGFNPLLHIKEDADVFLLSDLLVRAGKKIKKGDEHWHSRASELIACLIHLVLKMEKNPTLVQVRNLLLQTIKSREAIHKLFLQFANPPFEQSFSALTENKTNELSSIYSTASDALKDFSNPTIAEETSRNGIDLSSLRSQKTALFIQSSTNRSHLYHKIISIFFEQLYLELMDEIPGKDELDLFMLLDEFASLYLPTLPFKIDKVRKYRIGFLLAVQSLQQLNRKYGEDAITIMDNCKTHVFLGAQKGETAIEIEQSLGKIGNEYRMPREKCRMLDNDVSLILTNGKAPVVTKNMAYYRNPFFKHLGKKNVQENVESNNENPTEQLDEFSTDEIEEKVETIFYM